MEELVLPLISRKTNLDENQEVTITVGFIKQVLLEVTQKV